MKATTTKAMAKNNTPNALTKEAIKNARKRIDLAEPITNIRDFIELL
jgi:hypothetical protein